ncbi:MAG: phenylalanine--tRNA ligase subunit beta [Gemmatimonadota bacterium]|nr:phenylalanine--tRNA ligase subunit beta [Gemmatimonadota bacterium]
MNVSYRWLKALLPTLEMGPRELAEHLALRGAPVEEMVSPGEALADVVIGKVITAGRHPNADRLSLCTVEGPEGVVQVVCGAPNVTAGKYYPFAPVGAVLPGDFRIKKAKIRGEVSEGMLCSARELGLGQDHDGIMELSGEFTIGESFVGALGLDDTTMEVEITANRGDLLSHVGVAREAAGPGAAVEFPEIPGDPGVSAGYVEDAVRAEAGGVFVEIRDPDLCSRYLGAVIRGVRVGPSPAWLQTRLRGAGARPINNVVDATNYVMLEMGQPLHAFDLGRLGGSGIVVRRAAAGESTFTTLDGEERTLTGDMLMICDATVPVAIGGVMGGRNSEVEDDTVDVLLECALFDPKSIRATRRALGMSTDASYRFERGVDPEGMRPALERAVAIILATAGGALDGPVLDVCAHAFEAPTIRLRLARVAHVLGVPFTAAEVTDYLTPLGFAVDGDGDGILTVRVPGFRSYDVTREIDVIEEIARAHGYDDFPADLGAYRPGTVRDHPMFHLEEELRGAFVARGFFEAQTPAFVPEGEGDVRVSNPLNALEPFVRRTLAPSLLRRAEYNLRRGNRDVRLFEMGTSFRRVGPGEPPEEINHLVGVLTGRRAPDHWSGPSAVLDVWDLKSVMEEAAQRAYPAGARVNPADGPAGRDVPWVTARYEDGTVLSVVDADGREVGRGGTVVEGAMDVPAWVGEVFAFEMALPAEVIPTPTPVFQPLPQHPGMERDLALLVPDAVNSAAVTAVAREGGGEILREVGIFDVYRGEGIPPGMRSLAVRLHFQAAERTLKDKEVDRVVGGIVQRLQEELGVEHRG